MTDLYGYPIPAPYDYATQGDRKGQPLTGRWSRAEFGLLASVPGWTATELVHGALLVIDWDGYRVRYATRDGRTFSEEELVTARTRSDIYQAVDEMTIEQRFGAKQARLFLRIFGTGIDTLPGGRSTPFAGLPHQDWALVDAQVDGFWLRRSALVALAPDLGLIPVHCFDSLDTLNGAVDAVATGLGAIVAGAQTSLYGAFPVQGLVVTAPEGLLDRSGRRVMAKLRRSDYHRD